MSGTALIKTDYCLRQRWFKQVTVWDSADSNRLLSGTALIQTDFSLGLYFSNLLTSKTILYKQSQLSLKYWISLLMSKNMVQKIVEKLRGLNKFKKGNSEISKPATVQHHSEKNRVHEMMYSTVLLSKIVLYYVSLFPCSFSCSGAVTVALAKWGGALIQD